MDIFSLILLMFTVYFFYYIFLAGYTKKTSIKIINETKNTIIANNGVGAYTFFRRATGLLNHYSLDDDSALHIMPARKIHTKGMIFPIDVIMLDKRGVIVNLFENVPPSDKRIIYDGGRNAFSCVEAPDGTIYKSRCEIGDAVSIRDRK